MLNKILKVLIYATIFLVPVFFLPITFDFLEFNKLYLLFFLAWLAVLAWLIKIVVSDKKIKIKYSLFDLAIGLFLAMILLSSFASIDRVSSFFGSYGRFSGSVFLYFTLAAFYFLLLNNIGDASDEGENVSIGGIIKTLICSGLIVLFFIYLSLFGVWQGPLGALIASPASSTGPGTAMFLAVVLVLAVLVFLEGLEWGGFDKNFTSKKWKMICGVYIIFSLIALMIANFASAWVSLIFGFFLMTLLALKKKVLKDRVYKLMLPIALIIISCLFLVINTNQILYNTFLQNSPLILREIKLSQDESWQISGKVLGSGFKSAVLGNGPATFGYTFSKFRPESLNIREVWSIRFDRAGSYLAELLAETGILGFLSYLALIAILVLFVFQGKEYLPFRKNQKILGRTDIGINLLAIILLVLFLGQIFYYQNITLAFLFWLFIGAVLGLKGFQPEEAGEGFVKTRIFKITEKPEAALAVEVSIVIVGLLYITSCFFGFRIYLADAKYVQALNNPNLEQKVILLESSIQLNSYFPRYKMVLSQVYIRMAEERALQMENEEEQNRAIQLIAMAKLYAEGAVLQAPNRIVALENLANIYHRIMGFAQEREEFAQMAIGALEKASVLEPRNPGIYADIGDIYFALGKNDEAKEFFEKSINQIDIFVRGEISLALILEAENKKEEAIKKLESIAIRVPRDADALFHLGRMYYNENRLEEAITILKEVLEINTQHSNARFALGLAYEKQGKIKEAIEQLEMVLAANPDVQEVKERIERLKKGNVQPQEEMEELE